MRKFNAISVVGASVLVVVSGVHAQGLRAVRPLAGYQCMSLNLGEQQMMDPASRVPILAKPDASAPQIGFATATVIAESSPPVNGFQRVLRLDGLPGWIATSLLKPWRNPGGNGQKCVPSVMSNGRLGFGVG